MQKLQKKNRKIQYNAKIVENFKKMQNFLKNLKLNSGEGHVLLPHCPLLRKQTCFFFTFYETSKIYKSRFGAIYFVVRERLIFWF